MSDAKEKVFLAVDLGATSGRVMAGLWSEGSQRLELEEVGRFPSATLRSESGLQWDIRALFNSVKDALALAVEKYSVRIASIGVDSWAVDYGLIDENGELLDNPFHYRDSRTDGMEKAVQDRIAKETVYEETGIQFLFINTIYQLYSGFSDGFDSLKSARKILFIPDLITYWLSGRALQERTVASTSQLLNPSSGKWSEALIAGLDFPSELFGEIVEPGTIVGLIKPDIQRETGLGNVSVVAVAGHDTASAFIALPGNRKGFAVMSSGTWSLMGLELSEPQLGTQALADGFSNEIGYANTVRFLKNICGMWLIEECLRIWENEGRRYGYEAVVEMARESTPMVSLIDPDAPEFASPKNMPRTIAEFCERTGQIVPVGDPALIRCIFDSLAMKYRHVFRKLEGYSPIPLKGLYVLGGGARNQLLNQMTADALGVKVVTGPAEATAVGNIAVQMISMGFLSDLKSARDMVDNSFASEVFEPCDTSSYVDAAERFENVLAT